MDGSQPHPDDPSTARWCSVPSKSRMPRGVVRWGRTARKLRNRDGASVVGRSRCLGSLRRGSHVGCSSAEGDIKSAWAVPLGGAEATARAGRAREPRRATAFADGLRAPVGRAGAVRLARRTVPGARELGLGARLRRTLGPTRALIGSGRRSSLVLSGLPLVARGRALDLALESSPRGQVARNPLVAVTLPNRSSAAAQLDGLGLQARVLGAGDVRAVVADGQLLYPNALPDTDLALGPRQLGFELTAVLRSRNAPERLSVALSAPRGVTLKPAAGGAVTVLRDGHTAGTISAPRAWDADGRAVSVRAHLEGTALVLDVAHRTADLHYPVVVDPEFASFVEWRTNANLGFLGWNAASQGGAAITTSAIPGTGLRRRGLGQPALRLRRVVLDRAGRQQHLPRRPPRRAALPAGQLPAGGPARQRVLAVGHVHGARADDRPVVRRLAVLHLRGLQRRGPPALPARVLSARSRAAEHQPGRLPAGHDVLARELPDRPGHARRRAHLRPRLLRADDLAVGLRQPGPERVERAGLARDEPDAGRPGPGRQEGHAHVAGAHAGAGDLDDDARLRDRPAAVLNADGRDHSLGHEPARGRGHGAADGRGPRRQHRHGHVHRPPRPHRSEPDRRRHALRRARRRGRAGADRLGQLPGHRCGDRRRREPGHAGRPPLGASPRPACRSRTPRPARSRCSRSGRTPARATTARSPSRHTASTPPRRRRGGARSRSPPRTVPATSRRTSST